MKKRKILLIDNDLKSQSFLKELLLSRDWTLTITPNDRHSFEVACSEKPEVVILNFELQNNDALEVCRLLRTHHATQTIPLILLMASEDFEMKLAAFAEGADDIMLKPPSPRELLARVQNKLRRIDEKKTLSRFQKLLLQRPLRQNCSTLNR
jgi:DNA-binding response OmpR family regulator